MCVCVCVVLRMNYSKFPFLRCVSCDGRRKADVVGSLRRHIVHGSLAACTTPAEQLGSLLFSLIIIGGSVSIL